jgi:hypothetical protein
MAPKLKGKKKRDTKKKPESTAAGAGAGAPLPPPDPEPIVEEERQEDPGTPRRSPTPPPGSPAGSTRSQGSTRTDDTRAKKKRADPVTNLQAFSTTDQQEAFIEWWKGQPCLYNKKDAGYSKRDHTDEVRRMKAVEIGVTVDQMMKYMKHMRDAFNKVSKTVDIHTRSGSAQVDEGEFLSAHDTWLYRVMSWIKVHLQHHTGLSVGVSKPGILF